MRLRKRSPSTILALNMTPMIDVVFLLLIFFMTVSQVSKLQREPIQLPQVERAEEQQSAELTINVRQDGTILLAGEPVLSEELARELSRLKNRAGGDPSRLRVLIRADERSASRTVNELVTGLSSLGIQAVRIAVEVP
ncbi:MAG: biopolymer transporter ExbD/TolR [Nitrospiraceae bacterium]|nr:MAG: biopolymer transporter ExbD/TolR [Nitrospiraceae bacterium]